MCADVCDVTRSKGEATTVTVKGAEQYILQEETSQASIPQPSSLHSSSMEQNGGWTDIPHTVG